MHANRDSRDRARGPSEVSGAGGVNSPLEHDVKAARALVLDLMAIPGASGREQAVSDSIRERLVAAGAQRNAFTVDDVYRKSPFDGQTPSLIFHLGGTRRAARRLLMAHMDTVPLCVGSKPAMRHGRVVSSDPRTGLGADDRAGCAVVLTAALEILRRKLPHAPLVFLWTVQEEVGLHGAHFADLRLLRQPKQAFNFDGGSSEKVTIGATGAYRLTIEIYGLASHAGGAPEKGISAVTIAALAIAELHRDGWLGLIQKGTRRGTSNIGVVRGGVATNVVADYVELKAEARSHDPRFRREILKRFEQAFKATAGAVPSAAGACGKVKLTSRLDYESFQLSADEPCVLAAEAAVTATGGRPIRAISNGGVDANWLTARGIPTVTLGCGQQNPHTTDEALDLNEFDRACRVALRLATGTEK